MSRRGEHSRQNPPPPFRMREQRVRAARERGAPGRYDTPRTTPSRSFCLLALSLSFLDVISRDTIMALFRQGLTRFAYETVPPPSPGVALDTADGATAAAASATETDPDVEMDPIPAVAAPPTAEHLSPFLLHIRQSTTGSTTATEPNEPRPGGAAIDGSPAALAPAGGMTKKRRAKRNHPGRGACKCLRRAESLLAGRSGAPGPPPLDGDDDDDLV